MLSNSKDKRQNIKRILLTPGQQRTQADLQDLTQVLQSIKFFQQYKYTPKLRQFSLLVFLRSFTVKQTLFKQGDDGDFFFTVFSGRINLQVKVQGQTKVRQNLIGELKQGDSLGQLALMYGGARTCTAVAATGADILILNKSDYDKVVKGDQMKVKAKAIRFFSKMNLFKHIPEQIVEEIATRSMKPIEYKTSDIIIRQGDSADNFYVILKGRVKVLRRLDFRKSALSYYTQTPTNENYTSNQVESKIVEFQQLVRGDLFGAHEAFNKIKYQVSVVASMPTLVYRIQASDFKFVDAFELQQIVGSLQPCPNDSALRKYFIQNKQWKRYKSALVNSLRESKRFSKGYQFRMNPVKTLKSKRISPENMFKTPQTHRRLSPIAKMVQVSPESVTEG